MVFWSHHFELPVGHGSYAPYQTPFTHSMAAGAVSGSTATSAAREAGQAAFAHGAHLPPGGIPPHVPHLNALNPYGFPQVNYHSLHRYGRRGPRLLPLLVVGGAGVWGYHHLKHRVIELQDEVRSLKNVVFAQAQRRSGDIAAEAPVAELPVAAPEQRRRKWERRWSDNGQNVASISMMEGKLV